jgi:hypothetical protein
MITYNAIIRVRIDTLANWTVSNRTLEAGEIGIVSDTQMFKVGNGVTAWAALPYMRGDTDNIAAQIVLIQTALAVEETARQQADTTLQANIDAEAAAREQANTAQAQALSEEALARQSGDVLKADIESPHLSGIPTSPDASGNEPEQIVNFRTVNTLLEGIYDVLDMILPELRVTQAGDYICTQNGDALIIRNYT